MSPKSPDKPIPLYSYGGNLREWVSPSQLERLQCVGVVAKVVSRRNGSIVRATLIKREGEVRPMRLTDYLGTRYAFRQRLHSGHHTYRLRSLTDNPHNERDLAPSSVRDIFLAVALSCTAQALGSSAPTAARR